MEIIGTDLFSWRRSKLFVCHLSSGMRISMPRKENSLFFKLWMSFTRRGKKRKRKRKLHTKKVNSNVKPICVCLNRNAHSHRSIDRNREAHMFLSLSISVSFSSFEILQFSIEFYWLVFALIFNLFQSVNRLEFEHFLPGKTNLQYLQSQPIENKFVCIYLYVFYIQNHTNSWKVIHWVAGAVGGGFDFLSFTCRICGCCDNTNVVVLSKLMLRAIHFWVSDTQKQEPIENYRPYWRKRISPKIEIDQFYYW